jgi:hypothetical protein
MKRSFNICDLYSIQSKGRRWTGHASRILEMRNVYKILAGKPEGKRSLVIPKLQ